MKELGKQGVKKKKSTERKRARSDQEQVRLCFVSSLDIDWNNVTQGGGSAGDDGPRKRDNSAEHTSSDAVRCSLVFPCLCGVELFFVRMREMLGLEGTVPALL
jgi:hypothetical protein